MFDSYLIEIDDVEAGLLLRQGSAYVFHAVAPRWRGFEGTVFPDPWTAERTLRRRPPRRLRRTGGGSDGGTPIGPSPDRRRIG
jgi:hypothetical protein